MLFFISKPLDFIIQSLFHIIFFEFEYHVFEYFKNFKVLQQNFIVLFHYFKRLFFEIYSRKRKCLDNLVFYLNILAVRIGLGTLKAA